MPDSPPLPVVRYATFWRRLRGLIARPAPAPGTAVHIVPCGQVHTLGMRYAIDVVYLDRDGLVLAAETLTPWRLGRFVWHTASVLELCAGEAGRLGLVPGARPRLIALRPDATNNL